MSYESKAEPIKIGYLMDFLLSERFSAADTATISLFRSTWSSKTPWQGHHRPARRSRLPRGRRAAEGHGEKLSSMRTRNSLRRAAW